VPHQRESESGVCAAQHGAGRGGAEWWGVEHGVWSAARCPRDAMRCDATRRGATAGSRREYEYEYEYLIRSGLLP